MSGSNYCTDYNDDLHSAEIRPMFRPKTL